MFERLIDILIEFVELFQFFVYIDEFDRAVVLRAGRYNRTLEPGLRFIIPLAIEDVITVNIKPEPVFLDNQSVHTSDDYLINIQVGMSFRVTNPKTYLVDYEDTEDLIRLLVNGLVAHAVKAASWREANNPNFIPDLRKQANKIARKRGAFIDDLVLIDLANGRADRLWHEGISLSLGDDE